MAGPQARCYTKVPWSRCPVVFLARQSVRVGHFCEDSTTDGTGILNARAQRRKGAARQAATKESEQEETEKTEGEKLCRKCRVFADSTAKSYFLLCVFASLRLCVERSFPSLHHSIADAVAAIQYRPQVGKICRGEPAGSNPVQPSQSKNGGLTADCHGGGGKAALTRAHSTAASRPRARNAKRFGVRNASSAFGLKQPWRRSNPVKPSQSKKFVTIQGGIPIPNRDHAVRAESSGATDSSPDASARRPYLNRCKNSFLIMPQPRSIMRATES